MNLLDLILLLIIGWTIWNGLQKGFIIGVIDVGEWLGGLLLCFLLYPYVSAFILKYITTGIYVLPLSFFLTIIIIKLIFSFIAKKLFDLVPDNYHQSRINQMLGVFPGAFNGVIYVLIISSILILFPFTSSLTKLSDGSWVVNRSKPYVEKLQTSLSPYLEEVVKEGGSHLTINNEEFIKLGYTVKDAKRRPDLEAEMLVLINRERAKENLKPLKADPEIAEVALAHSADMFTRGYFSHYTPERKDPFDRMRAGKIRFWVAGENLALAQTLNIAHEGLMKSPGHRANILNRSFGRVGIGILDGGIYGLMITQNFRN